MATTVPKDQVTDAQLGRYGKLVYDRTGIRISPQKTTLLSNRIRRRLKATGIESFDAYERLLRDLDADDPEWDAFLQEITTHETYLFRDEKQWEWLQKEYLPQLVSDARTGKRDRSLRIWSAACSTGDECFTLATCIAATPPMASDWNIEILGTDIGIGALEEARRARFSERAMRLVPESLNRRFFTKVKDDEQWEAKPVLRDMITFRQHNLMDPFRGTGFDLVIVKNVLIYFDAASKKVVMDHIRAMVRPGGLLLVGAAEGVSDRLKDLERHKVWLYETPKNN